MFHIPLAQLTRVSFVWHCHIMDTGVSNRRGSDCSENPAGLSIQSECGDKPDVVGFIIGWEIWSIQSEEKILHL